MWRLRLVLLLLCIGFLPGVAGHMQRSVLGVVVLCLHLAILAAVFIGPSLLRMTMLVTRMMRGEPQEKQVRR
jgi:multidrug efflux pump subunit AcrB